jgi:hypothetical protein
VITICIEDGYFPFPYRYVGNRENLLRIPNNAQGAQALFFKAFSEKIPGYKNDNTPLIITKAMGAMEGTFFVWESADAE